MKEKNNHLVVCFRLRAFAARRVGSTRTSWEALLPSRHVGMVEIVAF